MGHRRTQSNKDTDGNIANDEHQFGAEDDEMDSTCDYEIQTLSDMLKESTNFVASSDTINEMILDAPNHKSASPAPSSLIVTVAGNESLGDPKYMSDETINPKIASRLGNPPDRLISNAGLNSYDGLDEISIDDEHFPDHVRNFFKDALVTVTVSKSMLNIASLELCMDICEDLSSFRFRDANEKHVSCKQVQDAVAQYTQKLRIVYFSKSGGDAKTCLAVSFYNLYRSTALTFMCATGTKKGLFKVLRHDTDEKGIPTALDLVYTVDSKILEKRRRNDDDEAAAADLNIGFDTHIDGDHHKRNEISLSLSTQNAHISRSSRQSRSISITNTNNETSRSESSRSRSRSHSRSQSHSRSRSQSHSRSSYNRHNTDSNDRARSSSSSSGIVITTKNSSSSSPPPPPPPPSFSSYSSSSSRERSKSRSDDRYSRRDQDDQRYERDRRDNKRRRRNDDGDSDNSERGRRERERRRDADRSQSRPVERSGRSRTRSDSRGDDRGDRYRTSRDEERGRSLGRNNTNGRSVSVSRSRSRARVATGNFAALPIPSHGKLMESFNNSKKHFRTQVSAKEFDEISSFCAKFTRGWIAAMQKGEVFEFRG